MHEFGLCEGVVEAIQRRAAGRRVARARVRLGALHRVVRAAFEQAFALAAAGTEAESASVELMVIPVRANCLTCNARLESDDAIAVCPKCGGLDLDLTGGEEIILESIEYAPAAGEPV